MTETLGAMDGRRAAAETSSGSKSGNLGGFNPLTCAVMADWPDEAAQSVS